MCMCVYIYIDTHLQTHLKRWKNLSTRSMLHSSAKAADSLDEFLQLAAQSNSPDPYLTFVSHLFHGTQTGFRV